MNNLVTNFPIEQRKIYEKAIKIYIESTRDTCLYLLDSAFDNKNKSLKNCNSLHATCHKDLSQFWRIFDLLKIEPQSLISHPQHYNQGKYEPIDVIKDWKLDFDLGNVVKYIARCEYKGNKIQDLNKALEYLQHEIKSLEEKQ